MIIKKQRQRLFFTTTCIEYKKFPDNCYEINKVRNFTDNYMMKFEEGKNYIQEYYKIDCSIVQKINKLYNKDDIYDYIYKNLISIGLINNNKMNEYYKNIKALLKNFIINI